MNTEDKIKIIGMKLYIQLILFLYIKWMQILLTKL